MTFTARMVALWQSPISGYLVGQGLHTHNNAVVFCGVALFVGIAVLTFKAIREEHRQDRSRYGG